MFTQDGDQVRDGVPDTAGPEVPRLWSSKLLGKTVKKVNYKHAVHPLFRLKKNIYFTLFIHLGSSPRLAIAPTQIGYRPFIYWL